MQIFVIENEDQNSECRKIYDREPEEFEVQIHARKRNTEVMFQYGAIYRNLVENKRREQQRENRKEYIINGLKIRLLLQFISWNEIKKENFRGVVL